ncbi:MAG: hypothetical protein AB7U81_13640 [Thiohalomonadaceae bacterium]
MEFNGTHCVAELVDGRMAIGCAPYGKQAANRGKEKLAATERGLKKAHPMERALFGVTGEVEDELHDLGAGEDGPSRLNAALTRQRLHRSRDRRRCGAALRKDVEVELGGGQWMQALVFIASATKKACITIPQTWG